MELVLPNHLLEPLNTLTVIKGDWHPVYFYIGKKKMHTKLYCCTPVPTTHWVNWIHNIVIAVVKVNYVMYIVAVM